VNSRKPDGDDTTVMIRLADRCQRKNKRKKRQKERKKKKRIKEEEKKRNSPESVIEGHFKMTHNVSDGYRR